MTCDCRMGPWVVWECVSGWRELRSQHVVHFVYKDLELFLFPSINLGAVHVTEHGNDPVEWSFHGVIVSVDHFKEVEVDHEASGSTPISIEYKWRISFECAMGGVGDNIDPLHFLTGLASCGIDFLLLFHHVSSDG